MDLINDLKKMNPWMKVLLAVASVLLLWGLFWPRQHTQIRVISVPNEGFYVEHMDGGEDQTVQEAMESGEPCMAMFYAPWCGYCKKTMPEWDRLASSYKKCRVVKVNCDVHKELGKKHGVKSYPTIKFLSGGLGNPNSGIEYQGERTMSDFARFVNQCISADPSVLPNQAAAISADVPPYRAGQGPLTTSFVARNFGLE